MVWVPEDMGIDRKEIADQLAEQGSSHPLTEPEPGLSTSISAKVAMRVIRDGTSPQQKEHWQSKCRHT
jgi:hypothetical protein